MSHVVPQEFRRFIEGEVADGAFLSVADAYQEALRLLQERNKSLESLRAELQIGRDQLDRGEAIRVE